MTTKYVVVSSAFVLISVDYGSEESIVSVLKSVEEIKEICRTNGVYDMVIRLESDSESTHGIVLQKIRNIPKVRSTLTLTTTGEGFS